MVLISFLIYVHMYSTIDALSKGIGVCTYYNDSQLSKFKNRSKTTLQCCANYRKEGEKCIPCYGATGPDCKYECPKGYFGFGCREICECDIDECDRRVGCINGTAEGVGTSVEFHTSDYGWVIITFGVIVSVGSILVVFLVYYIKETKDFWIKIPSGHILRRNKKNRRKNIENMTYYECENLDDNGLSHHKARKITNSNTDNRTTENSTTFTLERESYGHVDCHPNSYNYLDFNKSTRTSPDTSSGTLDADCYDVVENTRQLPNKAHYTSQKMSGETDNNDETKGEIMNNENPTTSQTYHILERNSDTANSSTKIVESAKNKTIPGAKGNIYTRKPYIPKPKSLRSHKKEENIPMEIGHEEEARYSIANYTG